MADQDQPGAARVLTINGGSSSVKFALFAAGEPPARLLAGQVGRIGLGGATLTAPGADGKDETRPIAAPDHGAAIAAVLDWLGPRADLDALAAVGHRVVHGGPKYAEPTPITAAVLEELRRICPFDPDHLAAEIAMIEALGRRLPGRPQVACFDTAFHKDMPRVAKLLPIPRRYEAAGVRRYGFHGLSYEFLMGELARVGGADAAKGRVVLAHLGNGASLAAVKDGAGIDTTMGFTPAAGLVMGTRTGDIDPGLVAYLARAEGMTAEGFDELVNKRSGLLGVSETSPDMRDLLAREAADPRAAEAVALFCYQARKYLGAMAAALGGLDTIVFAGGIGEHAAPVRSRICAGLGFLGVALDEGRNAADAAVISADGSRVAVRVIRTDEEGTIAQAVSRLLAAGAIG